MNKLVITQDNSRTEYPVPNSVITSLYSIGKDDDQHQTFTEGVDTTNVNRPISTVSGSIRVAAAYAHHLLYIAVKYPNLNITADSTYIYFADPEVERALVAAGIGDGTGISTAAAANANIGTALKGNTEITSFDEFGYFTKANTNPVDSMFDGCTNLASIDLSEITTFPYLFLRNTAIQTLNAPNLISFSGYLSGANAVSNCTQLTQVLNLGHVSVIPNGAFGNCANLLSVVLPLECVSLGNDSFIPPSNTAGVLSEVDGIDNITTFGVRCFKSLTSLRLGPNDLKNAQTINEQAFWYVPVSQINCKNLISLGKSAFRENQALTAVECLGTVRTIPLSCFALDSNLQTVKLPYECTSIETSAFNGCSALTSITQYNKSLDDYEEGELPVFTDLSRITSFGSSCFERCSLLQISASEIANATNIENKAFLNSGLYGTLHLANLVNGKVSDSAFENTQISNVILENITEIGNSAFYGTNISSIIIPATVRSCYINFVSNTTVQELIFPEGVEELLGALFSTKNNSLTYIEIPSTVTEMDRFFHRSLQYSSDGLCTVVIKATTPPTLNYYGNETNGTQGRKFSGIYVPDSSLTAYLNGANAWQHSSILAKLKPISQLLTDNPTAWAKYNRTSTV